MTRRTRDSTGHADSSGTESVNVRAIKTRRSHRKSRNGCIECKKRHIRCDERQPSCANCEVAGRTCFFPPPKTGKQKRRPETPAAPSTGPEASSFNNVDNVDNTQTGAEHVLVLPLALLQRKNNSGFGQVPDQYNALSSMTRLDTHSSHISSPLSPVPLSDLHNPPANCLPGLSGVPAAVATTSFTPQHLILLRHADTVPNFTAPNRNVVDVAIRRAVDSPYLIEEILAFTAFHLAHLYPGSAMHLQELATELQTRALAAFTRLTESVPNDDKATAVPRFLFSAILGRHVLADTLTHCRSDFHLFIDRFVECFNLNRGIRAVTPPARDFLYNSEIQPFLSVVLEAQKKITSPGNECDPLRHLMDDSDLSEASVRACRQAIEVLQQSFDICHGLEEEEYPQSASVFSVGIEIGFIDLLRKHRPEALAILAYYGVLLHRCRTFWAFGDAGAPIIRAVAGHVGSYWQEVLAWPLRVLEMADNSKPGDLAPR